jgi:hypothetical protein
MFADFGVEKTPLSDPMAGNVEDAYGFVAPAGPSGTTGPGAGRLGHSWPEQLRTRGDCLSGGTGWEATAVGQMKFLLAH